MIRYLFRAIIISICFLLLGCQQTYMGYKDCRTVRGYCNGSAPISVLGDSYFGAFNNGLRSGHGTYTWANGNRYIGNWSNNAINGNGVFYFTNGTIITGNFVNGQVNGFAKSSYTDKFDYSKQHPDCNNVVAYEGQWLNNSFNGKGTITYKNGSKKSGEFRGCTLISSNSNKSDKAQPQQNLKDARKECLILGFKDKSEKFGECVMDLIK